MHSIDSWLDRFCAKHRNWGVPNLMMYIVIGTAVVFVLDMFSHYSFSTMLSFSPYHIFHKFQFWRLITFVFVPNFGGNLFLAALSLYFYYFIGTTLEREWGATKFTVFYLMGVVMNIIVGLVLSFVYGTNTAGSLVDMFYINMSLFFAFASLFPDLRVLLFFIIPVKVKWLAWIDAALFGWGVLSSLMHFDWVGVILPIVAILNFVLFFGDDALHIFGRVRHQHSRQTVNFKKAAKEAKQNKGYLHKCAVCGVTDTDNPNMEFRYCSKCSGYYCYCMDHINNHVHIQ